MQSEDDQQQMLRLFEDGDRALMNADIAELARIFADDYVQYDESGTPHTKLDVLGGLSVGLTRYLSIVSTGRQIRLLGDLAIVHGSEEDEVESDGKRFSVWYIYMDVVCRRDGRWQIVGSQLARPFET
jgi:ketosteroid isomerase-like protein